MANPDGNGDGNPTCPYYGQFIPDGFRGCGGCGIARECYEAYDDSIPVLGPDPDALDFDRLLGLGMTPGEAAEVKDIESMPYEDWKAVYA